MSTCSATWSGPSAPHSPRSVADGRRVAAAAADLDALGTGRAALVIDDFHTLEGTPAETAVGQLLTYLPPSIHLLLGGRRPPRFDLSRLRVSDQLFELGPEDLRFRTWEVEELFRDHYNEPLSPEELADLTRRTGGWAAGLQLFHLATRGKPVPERSRVLRSLSTRLRSVREYLARNLLDGLDDELRTFLVQTSVLGRLSPPMCDELLGRTDSARLLAEAERRHLFLTSDDDGETYRSHEVLRSHLAEMLINEVGQDQARTLQQRAGALLEAAGDFAEALFAYWGAEDWSAADRLLGGQTEILGGPMLGLDSIPAGLTDRDGWMLLATARRQLAMGSWGAALDTYRRGETLFGGGRPSETCRRERMALVTWLDPSSPPGTDWTSLWRRALQREPLAVAAALRALPDLEGTAGGDLAAGLAEAFAGRLVIATGQLSAAANHPQASPVIAAFARFAAAVARRLAAGAAGSPDGRQELAHAVEAIDGVSPPWLGRLAQGFAVDDLGVGRHHLSWVRDLPDVKANPWAASLLATLSAGTALADNDPAAATDAADAAVTAFEALGAGTGAAWARALAALAAAATGDRGAPRAAIGALAAAHAADCPGALALACRVAAETGDDAGRALLLATAVKLEAAGALSLQRMVDQLLVDQLLAAPLDAVPGFGAGHGSVTGSSVTASSVTASSVTASSVTASSVTDSSVTDDSVTARTPPGGDALSPDVSGEPTRAGAPRRLAPVLNGPAAPAARAASDASAGRTPDVGERGALQVRCFGHFEVWLDDRPLNLTRVKPRARAVLQILAVGGGQPVHRDELLGALWPDDNLRSGTRNLQVAVSSLRQALDDGRPPEIGGAPSGSRIARTGDAYLLAVGSRDQLDVVIFNDALRQAAVARRLGDLEAGIAAGWVALGAYRGELLTGAGSAEWIVERRERYRLAAADTALHLAEALVQSGDPAQAVAAAERGLTVDRYRDGLWRVLVAALEANGDRAAAAKATMDYEAILTDLGVTG